MHNQRDYLIKRRNYKTSIAADNLSLYLANTPASAQYLAERIGNPDKVLLELCCGVGVTLEIMSKVFSKVTGVDYDPIVLKFCKENLEASNVDSKISLIHGNVSDIQLIRSLQADVVIYDIPYWYPEKYSSYDEEEKESIANPDLEELVSHIRRYITEDIVIFAPREQSYDFFKNELGECESQKVFINGKHDRNYIYLGKLTKQVGETEIWLNT